MEKRTINRMFADLVDLLAVHISSIDNQDIEDTLEGIMAKEDRKIVISSLDRFTRTPNGSQLQFWELVHLFYKDIPAYITFFESMYWRMPIKSASIGLVELLQYDLTVLTQVKNFIAGVSVEESIGAAILDSVLPNIFVNPFINVFLNEPTEIEDTTPDTPAESISTEVISEQEVSPVVQIEPHHEGQTATEELSDAQILEILAQDPDALDSSHTIALKLWIRHTRDTAGMTQVEVADAMCVKLDGQHMNYRYISILERIDNSRFVTYKYIKALLEVFKDRLGITFEDIAQELLRRTGISLEVLKHQDEVNQEETSLGNSNQEKLQREFLHKVNPTENNSRPKYEGYHGFWLKSIREAKGYRQIDVANFVSAECNVIWREAEVSTFERQVKGLHSNARYVGKYMEFLGLTNEDLIAATGLSLVDLDDDSSNQIRKDNFLIGKYLIQLRDDAVQNNMRDQVNHNLKGAFLNENVFDIVSKAERIPDNEQNLRVARIVMAYGKTEDDFIAATGFTFADLKVSEKESVASM